MNESEEVEAWARSGAMALCGRAGGPPLGPPRGLVSGLMAVSDELASLSDRLGTRVEVDPLEVLCQRAAIEGLGRSGSTSCGGATRLLQAADGRWLALSLARPDDWSLLPALFETGGEIDEGDWGTVTAAVAQHPAAPLVDRGATLLGLPMSRLGESACAPHAPSRPPAAPPRSDNSPPRLDEVAVVDLSALWAGPLAGSLLAASGAQVLKVESTNRPDGARSGPPEFFELLNGSKRSVRIDLSSAEGRRELRALVEDADVVITSSRVRAIDQLGLRPGVPVGKRPPQVWLSITGHGLDGPGAGRVAFGDDAAVAGGLVVSDEDGPCFCADAIADPLSGLVGAVDVLATLAAGRSGVIDLAMARVAARFAGST